ncbi:hypothetical protein HDV64DRAFT_150769 [Trichoderma sp. TUCIM 5745]
MPQGRLCSQLEWSIICLLVPVRRGVPVVCTSRMQCGLSRRYMSRFVRFVSLFSLPSHTPSIAPQKRPVCLRTPTRVSHVVSLF